MFVGHGLLAFALVAWAADRAGWDRERVLAVGALAFVFGLTPDIDMLYAPAGLLSGGFETPLGAARSFWAASEVTHRAATHSLLFGVGGALAVLTWSRGDRQGRVLAVALSGGLVWLTAGASGSLDAFIALAFVTVVLATATVGSRLGFAPRELALVAALGLLSHPFGDLFTGTPPVLLYPLDITVVAERVALSGDPTLHLLGAMGLELATIWLALVVWASLSDRQLRGVVEPWAAGGLVFAAGVLVLPAPTLDLSYPFVFSVLGVGLVTAAPRLSLDRAELFGAAVTGLTAVSVAVLAYAAAYVLVL